MAFEKPFDSIMSSRKTTADRSAFKNHMVATVSEYVNPLLSSLVTFD